ncbi:acyltransferase [Treponema zioleckii]|uniref:acyltransferase n=1 Tax=Treponema zioleckii TaxID=331680 RepID=UPI0018D6212F|nr:hypothetical protein [Treponema zioleckii]
MLLTLRRFVFSFLLDILPSSCFAWRRFVLRVMGVRIKKSARVNSGFRVYGGGPCAIGENVWIGKNCHVYTAGANGVFFDDGGEIGPECAFNCQTHKIGDESSRAGECILHDVKIGAGSWLGMRVTVLCESVGSGAVLGAGAVVLSDVPCNVLAAGVPAVVKKNL